MYAAIYTLLTAPLVNPRLHTSVPKWLVTLSGVYFFSCGAPPAARLDCSNLLPADQASFARVATLVTSSSAKGCAACHNTKSPTYGLNLEGPGVAWDAFATKMNLVYPLLATGQMPKGGEKWTDDELRLVRSWYCQGALYDGF